MSAYTSIVSFTEYKERATAQINRYIKRIGSRVIRKGFGAKQGLYNELLGALYSIRNHITRGQIDTRLCGLPAQKGGK